MELPTSTLIRKRSKVDFDSLEFEVETVEGSEPPETEDTLDTLVEGAIAYVEDVCGRPNLDTLNVPDISKALIVTGKECIIRRVEQMAFKSQETEAETASDIDMIQGFSAGSYSETRVNDIRATGKASGKVNSWPILNDLLWRFMTEEKREWWREQWGEYAPYSEITEVDWDGTFLMPPLTGMEGSGV